MKLEEAAFFLDLAEKSQDNRKAFGFFINAFFAAAASIRVNGGVMAYQYRNAEDFKDWLKEENQKLNVEFPYEFWVVKTRNGIIHREGNIQDELRRKVTTSLTMKTTEDGSMSVYRSDPPPTTDCVLLGNLMRRKEEMS